MSQVSDTFALVSFSCSVRGVSKMASQHRKFLVCSVFRCWHLLLEFSESSCTVSGFYNSSVYVIFLWRPPISLCKDRPRGEFGKSAWGVSVNQWLTRAKGSWAWKVLTRISYNSCRRSQLQANRRRRSYGKTRSHATSVARYLVSTRPVTEHQRDSENNINVSCCVP